MQKEHRKYNLFWNQKIECFIGYHHVIFRNTDQLFFIISQTEVNFKGKQEKNDDKISKELAKQSRDLQSV